MADAKKDKLQIRNSTVDFLVFTKDAHEDGIEVRVQDHDVWLTQKAIAQLFDVDRSVVTKHLKNVYESGELSEDATCANFAQVADNGKTYHYKFYSLSAIIAVGYRINSGRATQFRQWATKVLDTFTKQGYVLDKSRLINGQIFDEDYFDHLISEIQEIRASERRFYQKITDIYATAVDYSLDSQTTKDFFAMLHNRTQARHGRYRRLGSDDSRLGVPRGCVLPAIQRQTLAELQHLQKRQETGKSRINLTPQLRLLRGQIISRHKNEAVFRLPHFFSLIICCRSSLRFLRRSSRSFFSMPSPFCVADEAGSLYRSAELLSNICNVSLATSPS